MLYVLSNIILKVVWISRIHYFLVFVKFFLSLSNFAETKNFSNGILWYLFDIRLIEIMKNSEETS